MRRTRQRDHDDQPRIVRRGVEVIYLGYHRSVTDIVRAAIQEDVQAVGISSYNGGHVEFFSEVIAKLRKAGAAHIGVFGGGGGTITAADEKIMRRSGVSRIFFAGTPLEEICDFVLKTYERTNWERRRPAAGISRKTNDDQMLSRAITHAGQRANSQSPKHQSQIGNLKSQIHPAPSSASRARAERARAR